MPETVVAWKIVTLIASGRKNTERTIKDVVHQMRLLVPQVRIDTGMVKPIPVDIELDSDFERGLNADIIVGVIDEVFCGTVIESSAISEEFLIRVTNLIDFTSEKRQTPKALFIRLRPDAPNEAFRARIMPLLNSSNQIFSVVHSNRELESVLHQFFWEHLSPLHELTTIKLPLQGAGPHFGLSVSGKIASTPAANIDQSGNDLNRINQLLPLIRECADEFLATSGSLGNQYPTLFRDVGRYKQLILKKVELIEWGTLWGIGVKLETSTASAERKVADRLAPELEDEPLTALQSLRNLHAPLILATAEGRELQEQADRMRMTRGEQEALRDAAVALSEGLIQNESIIEPEAAAMVAEAAETVGTEPHPERGTTYGIASLKNMTIVLFGAGLATVPKLVLGNYLGDAGTMGAWEAMKRWPAFAKAADALGKDFQGLVVEERAVVQAAVEQLMPFRNFIVLHEQHLRAIARATPQLKWLLHYIEYIVRKSHP